jgi:23S rRNA (uridine2552-2'-O)-methyltransferase
MAPYTMGHRATDHLRIIHLAEYALEFVLAHLDKGGSFVCKLFQGGETKALLDVLKKNFASVRHIKPKASRPQSSELYVVAQGFQLEKK